MADSHRVVNIEVLWDGTYGLSSLSEKTRKSNRLQMSLQRQHFLLSYLKTLSVGPAGVRTHDLPHGSPVLNQLSQPVGGYYSGSKLYFTLNVVRPRFSYTPKLTVVRVWIFACTRGNTYKSVCTDWNCWIVTYPLNKVIRPLNNWGQIAVSRLFKLSGWPRDVMHQSIPAVPIPPPGQ